MKPQRLPPQFLLFTLQTITIGSDRTPIAYYPEDHPEGGPLAAATISGAPIELQARTVR